MRISKRVICNAKWRKDLLYELETNVSNRAKVINSYNEMLRRIAHFEPLVTDDELLKHCEDVIKQLGKYQWR
jgi:hypothetical protein